MASAIRSYLRGRPGHPPLLAVGALLLLGLLRAVAAPAQPAQIEQPPASRPAPGASLAINLGWNYLTVPGGVAPDYQNLRLRLAGSVPSFWGGRAGLRMLVLEKTGVDERAGGASGTRFLTRHQIKTLALELRPRDRVGATLGRHRPVTNALGSNDIDGITLRFGRPRGRVQATAFGGFNVEYWEAEIEPEQLSAGAALAFGDRRKGPRGEVSSIYERFEKGNGRTRVGVDGAWRSVAVTLDGRSEADLTAGLLTYARLSAAGKVGRRLAPYIQAGHRRGLLFTDSPTASGEFADTVGYRRSLEDASIGTTWRVSEDWTIDGRVSAESGLRSTTGMDVSLRGDALPFGFEGRAGFGAAKSIWAHSVRGAVGFDHAWGSGRASFDGTAVAYRWRRPGLSSSTRWRFAPSVRFSRPVGRGASLLVSGREILDDRLNTRSEIGAWISYRIGP